MKMPLVSIIVPSYRHRKYIYDCLASFLDQHYANLELIIIDDASCDGSANVIRAFIENFGDSFTHTSFIEHQTNLGLIASLNEATAIARGEYFILLASDDALMSNVVPKQVALMEANRNLGAISGNVVRIDDSGRPLHRLRQRYLAATDISFERMWKGCVFSAAGAMIRASSFRAVGGYAHDIIYEDWYLWLKLLDGGFALHRSADRYAYYRYHAQNMHRNVEMMERGKALVVKKFEHRPDFDQMMNVYTLAQGEYLLSMVARKNKWSYVKKILFKRRAHIKLADLLALILVWRS
jgi:alpha-1,3-rhamnosyltransferase